jgi:ribosomal protein L1
LENYKIS